MLREKARRPLDLTDTKQNLGKFTTAEGYATRLPNCVTPSFDRRIISVRSLYVVKP